MSQAKRVLCVIDIQKEYNTLGRPFCIPQVQDSLQQAAELLAHARKKHWPVVHVQHLNANGLFARGDQHADFIEGFAPMAGEFLAVKENYSSFSSLEFASFLDAHKDKEIVVMGYGSTMCCLSTIVDGYHRGFRMTLAKDASAAKPTEVHSSEVLHKAMSDVLGAFAKVQNVRDIKS